MATLDEISACHAMKYGQPPVLLTGPERIQIEDTTQKRHVLARAAADVYTSTHARYIWAPRGERRGPASPPPMDSYPFPGGGVQRDAADPDRRVQLLE